MLGNPGRGCVFQQGVTHRVTNIELHGYKSRAISFMYHGFNHVFLCVLLSSCHNGQALKKVFVMI